MSPFYAIVPKSHCTYGFCHLFLCFYVLPFFGNIVLSYFLPVVNKLIFIWSLTFLCVIISFSCHTNSHWLLLSVCNNDCFLSYQFAGFFEFCCSSSAFYYFVILQIYRLYCVVLRFCYSAIVLFNICLVCPFACLF